MILTKPSVRLAVMARSASPLGRHATRAPGQAAAACGSVMPTCASSGSANTTYGIATVVNGRGGDQRFRNALRAARRPIVRAAWVNGIRPVTSPPRKSAARWWLPADLPLGHQQSAGARNGSSTAAASPAGPPPITIKPQPAGTGQPVRVPASGPGSGTRRRLGCVPGAVFCPGLWRRPGLYLNPMPERHMVLDLAGERAGQVSGPAEPVTPASERCPGGAGGPARACPRGPRRAASTPIRRRPRRTAGG
jgi:hypothetical protein